MSTKIVGIEGSRLCLLKRNFVMARLEFVLMCAGGFGRARYDLNLHVQVWRLFRAPSKELCRTDPLGVREGGGRKPVIE